MSRFSNFSLRKLLKTTSLLLITSSSKPLITGNLRLTLILFSSSTNFRISAKSPEPVIIFSLLILLIKISNKLSIFSPSTSFFIISFETFSIMVSILFLSSELSPDIIFLIASLTYSSSNISSSNSFLNFSFITFLKAGSF